MVSIYSFIPILLGILALIVIWKVAKMMIKAVLLFVLLVIFLLVLKWQYGNVPLVPFI